MERTLKIFISCALGAGIGTLVALELNYYFWWFGLLTGGVAGYLSYEFKEVLVVIHIAWHKIIGYRPDKQKVARNFLELIVLLNIYLSFALILFATLAVGMNVISSFFFSLIWVTVAATIMEAECNTGGFCKLKKGILFLNPIAIFTYWPVWYLWKAGQVVIYVIKRIPRTALLLIQFVKMVFVLIHSDIRLLCGVDAAIGAGIGYFAGSVIIGMLAGGMLGVVNYEIVSKRLLKCAQT